LHFEYVNNTIDLRSLTYHYVALRSITKYRQGDGNMPKESKNMRSITIRVDNELYDEYKEVLYEQSKIVTYDIRQHMRKTINDYKQKKAQSD